MLHMIKQKHIFFQIFLLSILLYFSQSRTNILHAGTFKLKTPNNFMSPRYEILELIKSNLSSKLKEKLNNKKWLSKVQLEKPLPNGETILTEAIKLKSFLCAKVIIEAQILNNKENSLGFLPIQLAIDSENIDLINALINQGDHLNQENVMINNKICDSIISLENLQLKKHLLTQTIDLHQDFTLNNIEKIFIHLISRKLDIVLDSFLSQKKLDLNRLPKEICLRIYLAALEAKNWKMIYYFLDQGYKQKDPYLFCNGENSDHSLIDAVEKNDTELFRILWDYSKDNPLSYTILEKIFITATTYNALEIIKIISVEPMPTQKKIRLLQRSLSEALFTHHVETLEYLLNQVSILQDSKEILEHLLFKYIAFPSDKKNSKIVDALLSTYSPNGDIEENKYMNLMITSFSNNSDLFLYMLSTKMSPVSLNKKNTQRLIYLAVKLKKVFILKNLIHNKVLDPNEYIPNNALDTKQKDLNLFYFSLDNNIRDLTEEILRNDQFDPHIIIGSYEKTYINKAIQMNDVYALESLLKITEPEVLENKNIYEIHPIFTVLHSDNLELLKVILKFTSNINFTNNLGQTPLALAIMKKSRETVKILLNANAQINGFSYWKTNDNLLTPLMYAAAIDDYELATFLINHGALARTVDLNGNYTSHYASNENMKTFLHYIEFKETLKYKNIIKSIKEDLDINLLDLIFFDLYYEMSVLKLFLEEHINDIIDGIKSFEHFEYFITLLNAYDSKFSQEEQLINVCEESLVKKLDNLITR